MKILMVTPYPPVRDGIAAYALQTVARLRREGHDVEVLSPGPSAAHHHLALSGPRGALALAKRVRKYDRVVVQFHPDVFYVVPASRSQWAIESLALFVTFRLARQVEVRVHEIDYTKGQARSIFGIANRLPWTAVNEIVVHTEVERESFAEAYRVPSERVTVTDHGSDFRPYTTLDQTEARASFGIPADDFVFLNIGFIQPHKGFDRSVRAFARLGTGTAGRPNRLDIVGSVRTADPAYLAYVEELRGFVAATPGACLHEGFVTDELFDRWIVAADVVVLPYRSIWSSGVLERALLYQRPVIATDVGGLQQQRGAREWVTLVKDDAGLWRAMRDAQVTLSRGISDTAVVLESGASESPWRIDGELSRDFIQSEVRRRAAAMRGSTVATASTTPSSEQSHSVNPSAPVRNLPPLAVPTPTSSRVGARTLKRLVRRLTGWEIEPIVHQLNALREATIKSIDR